MAKVLIIEDDDVIARGMARHLETAGFDAVGVANGETGLARLRYERPDVCVLDLMLPGIDGWRVIEQARGEGIGTPIVVVSARGTEHDRVHALEIGADDYLVKPFSMKELTARVRAAARRGVSEAEPRRGDPIEIEELRLDPDNVQAYVDGVSAELTPTEFRLIYTLAREKGESSRATSSSSASGAAERRTATALSTSSSASCARRSTAARSNTPSSTRATASATSSRQKPRRSGDRSCRSLEAASIHLSHPHVSRAPAARVGDRCRHRSRDARLPRRVLRPGSMTLGEGHSVEGTALYARLRCYRSLR